MAEDVQKWGAALLEGRIHDAYEFSKRMLEQGFNIYVTRDLEIAKRYVCERYEDDKSKRYGLLASSKDKTLPRYGVMNDYDSTQRMKIGQDTEFFLSPFVADMGATFEAHYNFVLRNNLLIIPRRRGISLYFLNKICLIPSRYGS